MRFSLKPSPEPTERRLPYLMPPKVDPYATPAQGRIDLLLIGITAVTVAILLLTGSHGRAESATHTRAPTAEKASH